MIARSGRRAPFSTCALSFVSAALLLGAGAAAQRLEKPVQDWFKQYRLLVLPEEVKVLQQLKPADLEEFTRIFWARRNPDAGAGENPYRASIEKMKVAADARFGDVGKKGSETACGQVTMLLGNPDEMTGREVIATFDNRPERGSQYRQTERASRNATRDGARRPELWTYKSTATRMFRMPGGDLKLQFDDGCEFDEGARTLDELARLAAERVVHPEIRYEFGADGRLRPPARAVPVMSPARALLDQPRSDFVATFEPKIQVPGQGGAYTAGTLQAAAGSLPVPSGASPLRLRAAVRATPASGPFVDSEEKDVYATVRPDGSFFTSCGFTLPPGRYRIAVAVVEPASGRGAVSTVDLESPDYASQVLVVSPLAVLSGDAGPTTVNDPLAAFSIGSERLAARPGNLLGQQESLKLLVLVHNAALDPATRRASLRASFSVLQDGKVIARGKDQTFDTAGAAPTVGPIALAPFAPGRYLARVEVSDEVAKTVVVRETAFEVSAVAGR